ncbi:hypothetical protein Enr13x_23870 [Stieleria neptunia]|uniref:VWFA domain-containing protein n=1 Tax=Stieleria neptunia TaxID=2527979 RepID=A0A518HNX7_9BACT|nr:hypothetical protein [Stieleria neptunia]QDV42539.1 hypothetical protein Enr13x_23870 [Stieleria neptunia]
MNPRTRIFQAALLSCIAFSGCVKKQETVDRPVFEPYEIDSCLAISIDLSGSFANDFGERAYPLVLDLMDTFTDQSMGAECKIVLSQMSGHDQVVLFEGSPAELRHEFGSPEQMATFLRDHSKPDRSPIYVATRKTVDYVNLMNGISEKTRVLTVILSDMRDSESDQSKRSQEGFRMLASLETYRERGGSLALYFVEQEEVPRWKEILGRAGFAEGQFVISNSLESNPQLPRFD